MAEGQRSAGSGCQVPVIRPAAGRSSGSGPLVVGFLFLVFVLGVMVRADRVIYPVTLVRSYAQLRTQPVKVCAAAVVLQLAGNLHLLGLGSAAPHWLDPPQNPEP